MHILTILPEVPERILDLLVIEGVNGDLNYDVEDGDHKEGEQEKHDSVDEGGNR